MEWNYVEVGTVKSIVSQLSVYICGVRLSGMGVAIGSLIGKELAEYNGN
jgi:hypothetical protein